MPYQLPAIQTEHLKKPILIWDGQCGFCKYWVIRWQQMTGGKVDYAPYQEVGEQFDDIPESEFRKAAFLVEPDGRLYRGMGAAFRTFTYGSGWGFLYRWYTGSYLFRKQCDGLYRWIVRNRSFLYKVTTALCGKDPEKVQAYWLIYLLALLTVVVFLLAIG